MADVSCQGCGAANEPGRKFCTECGTALVATCPQCGAPGASGKFCGECGASLAPVAAATPSPPAAAGVATFAAAPEPVSERRIVSLLFADLVGFTPLSESRDPEAVRELLSAYFDRARAVVER